jgi:hypothetical protein
VLLAACSPLSHAAMCDSLVRLQVVPMLLPSAVVAAYSAVACFVTTGFVLGAAATAVGLPYLLTLTVKRVLCCTISARAPALPLSLVAMAASRRHLDR